MEDSILARLEDELPLLQALAPLPLFSFDLQSQSYGAGPYAFSNQAQTENDTPDRPPLFAPQTVTDENLEHILATHQQSAMESEEYESEDSAFDHVATIAPARLELQGDEFDEDPEDYEFAYGVLEFPDTCYFIKEPSLILGRDTKLQKWLDSRQSSRRSLQEAARRHLQQNDTATFDHDPERTPSSSHTSDEEIPQVSGGLGVGNQPEVDNATRLPNGVVFLPIHCPIKEEDGDIPNLNAISKMHVRLTMDEIYGWELTVLGRNGVLLNNEYYYRDAIVQLQDGDKIQISDLVLFFRCPMANVDEDEEHDEVLEDDADLVGQTAAKKRKRTTAETGDDEEPLTKKPLKIKLSLKKTDEPAVANSVETPSQSQGPPQTSQTPATPAVDGKEKSVSASVAPDEAEKKKSRSKYPDDPSELLRNGEVVPQKRGPGRPPKNGIMSKREMKERLKAKEEETRRELGDEAAKQLSARYGKGDADDKKKKQRRRSNDDDDRKKDDGPREPSPKMEDYTPQQLEKPTHTYAELLYPLLQETGPLSLQEIYRHFEKRWPYYKFGCKGTGWQSSIRHTVNTNVEKGEGHFVKDAKDGKGFKWAANPNNPVTQKPARVSNPTPSQPPTYQGSAANGGYNQQHYSATHPTPANMQYQQRPPAYYPPAANGQQSYQSGQYRPPQAGAQSQGPPGAATRPPSHPGAPGAPQGYHPPPPYQQTRPHAQTQASGTTAGQAPVNRVQPPGQTTTATNTYRPNSATAVHGQGQQPHQTGSYQTATGVSRPPQAAALSNPYQSQTPRPAPQTNANGTVTTQAHKPPPQANATASTPYQQTPAQRPAAASVATGPAQHEAPASTPNAVPPRPGSSQQMPPVEQWSGLELLMRGKYPAVFDQFKTAFVDSETEGEANATDAQKQENKKGRARIFAKMVSWFTSQRTIDREPPAGDDELKHIYDVVKQLLVSEHKATLKKRAMSGSRVDVSRSTTPAGGSPVPRPGNAVNSAPSSAYSASAAANNAGPGPATGLGPSSGQPGSLLNRPLHTATTAGAAAPPQASRPAAPGDPSTTPKAGIATPAAQSSAAAPNAALPPASSANDAPAAGQGGQKQTAAPVSAAPQTGAPQSKA